MVITAEHKEKVIGGIAEKLQELAKKGNFPIDVTSLVSGMIDVMTLEKVNSMLGMCTFNLYIAKSENKYMLMKKR